MLSSDQEVKYLEKLTRKAEILSKSANGLWGKQILLPRAHDYDSSTAEKEMRAMLDKEQEE